MNRVKYAQQSQRWIVKTGSALLTQDGKGLDYASIADWAQQIAQLRKQGIVVKTVKRKPKPLFGEKKKKITLQVTMY